MILDNILTCSRCVYSWVPKGKKNPKYCPNCKSPYWNKPRKRINKESIQENKDLIMSTHEAIISISGGEHGVRDDAGVYFSVYNMLNYIENHFGNPISIGAYIYNEFAKKHHFNDGNKRTAHVIAKIIMLIMRCHLKIEYKDALSFIIEIAKYDSKLSLNDIRKWLNKNCVIVEREDIEKYLNKVLVELVIGERNEKQSN